MVIWCCQLSSRYFVILDFYLNREAIAEALCINQDKPEMQCNGSCALKEKLQQEDRRNQESPERKAENKNEVLYLIAKNTLPDILHSPDSDQQNYNHPNSIGVPIDRKYTIFRPPSA